MHFLLLIVKKERGGPPTNGIGKIRDEKKEVM